MKVYVCVRKEPIYANTNTFSPFIGLGGRENGEEKIDLWRRKHFPPRPPLLLPFKLIFRKSAQMLFIRTGV